MDIVCLSQFVPFLMKQTTQLSSVHKPPTMVKAALIVEHLQNDFIHPEGCATSKDHRHLAKHINDLVKYSGFALKDQSRALA